MIGPKIKVILEKYTETSDTYGTHIETWEGVRYIEGTMVANNGQERLAHGKNEVYSSHIFYCDWQIGITFDEKYRLRYDQRIFDIVYVGNPVAQDRWSKIYLDEVV